MDPRPVITQHDMLAQLSVAMSTSNPEFFDDWLKSQSMSKEALVAAAQFIASAYRISGSNIEVGLLSAFMAGWDVHRSFRGERLVVAS